MTAAFIFRYDFDISISVSDTLIKRDGVAGLWVLSVLVAHLEVVTNLLDWLVRLVD